MIWYFTAETGDSPARICPVMMPGSVTSPAADMVLTIGSIPRRTASRINGRIASRNVAPRASCASIAARSRVTAESSASSESEAALSALPSMIPASGMA